LPDKYFRPSLRSLPLNALRTFEAAARHLSFKAAAKELGVTPAAVSHQIRDLERTLGLQLFLRLNRAVRLSARGSDLAQSLTELFASMVQLVADSSNHEVSSLEISAMPSFAARWLAPRLARFTIQHPDCRIRIVGEDRLVDFRLEACDIGIRYGTGTYKGLYVERLAEVEAFPVVSPAFALAHRMDLRSPDGLRRLPLLHDESSLIANKLPNWQGWLDAAGVHFSPSAKGVVFESVQLAIEAALAGQGVALALSPLVDAEIKSGRLVRYFDLALKSPYSFWLVCRRHRARDARIAQFREWIQSELRGA
jgi:LysR family glycine cleavage system transcriptional activator